MYGTAPAPYSNVTRPEYRLVRVDDAASMARGRAHLRRLKRRDGGHRHAPRERPTGRVDGHAEAARAGTRHPSSGCESPLACALHVGTAALASPLTSALPLPSTATHSPEGAHETPRRRSLPSIGVIVHDGAASPGSPLASATPPSPTATHDDEEEQETANRPPAPTVCSPPGRTAARRVGARDHGAFRVHRRTQGGRGARHRRPVVLFPEFGRRPAARSGACARPHLARLRRRPRTARRSGRRRRSAPVRL